MPAHGANDLRAMVRGHGPACGEQGPRLLPGEGCSSQTPKGHEGQAWEPWILGGEGSEEGIGGGLWV